MSPCVNIKELQVVKHWLPSYILKQQCLFVCLCGQCLEDSSSHCPFPINNSFEHTEHGVINCFSFWPHGVCLHWGGVHQNLDMEFLRT